MIGMISIALLAISFMAALASAYQLSTRRNETVARRLIQFGATDMILDAGATPRTGSTTLSRILAFFATLAPSSLRGQDLRLQMAGAGWYGAESVKAFIGAKILTAGLLGGLGYVLAMIATLPQSQQTLIGAVAGMIGLQIPTIFLKVRTARRRAEMRLALPDALDLLVVCVEAGLGLNAAIVRVGRDLTLSCRPLAEEFHILNQEIRAGTPRAEALRNLSARVPISDMKSLVAMFVQTDRLGTSIARSLRVHSDSLRTKRRQRAEENARKATIKLIFPLVFFIFPELLVVTLGPAGITLFDTLSDMIVK